MQDYWAPHVTVAAVVERDGRFLMVEERDEHGSLVINQPAGHLEPGESLLDAVCRETREETGHDFQPQGLLGIYQWRRASDAGGNQASFLRFAFTGSLSGQHSATALDPEILGVHWLFPKDIHNGPWQLRSPMVLRCLEDSSRLAPLPLERLQQLHSPS